MNRMKSGEVMANERDKQIERIYKRIKPMRYFYHVTQYLYDRDNCKMIVVDTLQKKVWAIELEFYSENFRKVYNKVSPYIAHAIFRGLKDYLDERYPEGEYEWLVEFEEDKR